MIVSSILECRGISKTYGGGPLAESVLRGVSLTFHRGETWILLGPSGSGKTTLLSILGCLLSPSSGELEIDGKAVSFRSQERLCEFRRRCIGFVFQHAQLLPFLSMEENLRVAGRNAGLRPSEVANRTDDLLSRLNVEGIRRQKPSQVSGGQRQRVAVARAVLHRPPIILADEPTAALDWHNGEAVVRLMVEQAKAENALLIAVTHDTRLVPFFDRVLRFEAGKVCA
jgi:putative ABC transport system ATP-binding protein